MADRLYRAQVTIPLTSGNPLDSVQNTFYFDDDSDDFSPPEDSITRMHSLLGAFYHDIDNTVFPNTVGDTATVKYYDMRDAQPRVPKDTRTFSLTPSASGPLPGEVALCLSFKATPSSGVPLGRLRGRIFLGPLNATAVEVADAQLRPNAGIIDVVRDAAEVLMAGVDHGVGSVLRCHWSIYSPTIDASSSIDDAFNDVTSGWVDNAFDTQRRRGAAPTSRNTF